MKVSTWNTLAANHADDIEFTCVIHNGASRVLYFIHKKKEYSIELNDNDENVPRFLMTKPKKRGA